MKRPCRCDRFRPGEPFDPRLDCALCWRYHHDPQYHALYDGQPVPPAPTPPPERKPADAGPAWWRKAANFARAAVRHAWHGLPETPTPEQERRVSICLACPLLAQDTGRCTHVRCGCNVAKKTTWLMEQCPLGKW
jgi:hypothetical protein